MATTDLTQPINRKEAQAIKAGFVEVADKLRSLIARAQGNGHDDAPDYADDALSLVSSAIESIDYELDNARASAA